MNPQSHDVFHSPLHSSATAELGASDSSAILIPLLNEASIDRLYTIYLSISRVLPSRMANPETSRVMQFAKNLSLFILSFVFLPTNALFALVLFLWDRFTSKSTPSNASQNDQDNLDKTTILVTGVNMAKGLSLARLFHRRGHRVIGADCYALSPGRVSRAIDAYYQLPPPSDPSKTSMNDPYLNRITEIIHYEDVDLWVSVSDVNAAIEDAAVREIIEARTNARAIQFGVEDIRRLHEKDAFIEHTKSLGLTVPLTEAVEDREDVINFLCRNGGLELKPGARQYLVKPVGVDDVARFTMPLLPLNSEDATLARIDTIPFKEAKCSFIIQEYITGPEFCTHALVIRGRVCAFPPLPYRPHLWLLY